MGYADKFELHYYFGDESHEIDALVRNKCEAELLGIILEAANYLGIDADLIKDAYKEGGFRDIWKARGLNPANVMMLLTIVQIILQAIPLLDSENKNLEKEERKLSIEEKKLNIEKLKQEIEKDRKEENIAKAADSVGLNLRIIKRKSNFYSHLDGYRKVQSVGFSILDDQFNPVRDEKIVPRSEFSNYVLSTNRLKPEQDDNAVIELISPVITDGDYSWKGLYQGKPISFEMKDRAFHDEVVYKKLSFKHGSRIVCVLVTNRELNEIGDIKIKGYAVTTVLDKTDGDSLLETAQGRIFRHAKKLSDSEVDLFS